jgi:hypothetical protein
MERKFLFFLFWTLGAVKSQIINTNGDNSIEKGSEERAIPHQYLPQIFDPFSQQFLNILMKNQQKIDAELNFDSDSIEKDKIIEKFHEIRPILTEAIGNILKECKIFRLQVKKISFSEQTNVLVSEFNEDVLNHASYLFESAEIFHERIHTLFQLSDDQFIRIRANQVREVFEMYLMTFREESKEFNQRLTSTVNKLNELKEKSSEESYFNESNDEQEDLFGQKMDDITSEGLESLYVHKDQQDEL